MYLAGYSKINDLIKRAREDGLTHVWIDTCCINKESSAELSLAINSMYRWYECADICYVLLQDFSYREAHMQWGTREAVEGFMPKQGTGKSRDINVLIWQEGVRHCCWFERGWTLQEMIAPKVVVFYDANWTRLFSKSAEALYLSNITGVPPLILKESFRHHILECSIAARMSWAAKRKTTRMEDIAYSLMGIFDVNMPLLYGEGEQAFIRLQEHIMKISDDQSIFAWDAHLSHTTLGAAMHHLSGGMLAPGPAPFARAGDVRKEHASQAEAFELTNRGLRFRRATLVVEANPDAWFAEALLHLSGCSRGGNSEMFVPIHRFSENLWYRNAGRPIHSTQPGWRNYQNTLVEEVYLKSVAQHGADAFCRIQVYKPVTHVESFPSTSRFYPTPNIPWSWCDVQYPVSHIANRPFVWASQYRCRSRDSFIVLQYFSKEHRTEWALLPANQNLITTWERMHMRSGGLETAQQRATITLGKGHTSFTIRLSQGEETALYGGQTTLCLQEIQPLV